MRLLLLILSFRNHVLQPGSFMSLAWRTVGEMTHAGTKTSLDVRNTMWNKMSAARGTKSKINLGALMYLLFNPVQLAL